MLLFSLPKNEEITFPHEFIFVFILWFIGTIFSEKSCQKGGSRKEYKRGDHVGGLSIEGDSNLLHTNIEKLKGGGDLGALNYWGDLIWKGELQTPLHTMRGYGGMGGCIGQIKIKDGDLTRLGS